MNEGNDITALTAAELDAPRAETAREPVTNPEQDLAEQDLIEWARSIGTASAAPWSLVSANTASTS